MIYICHNTINEFGKRDFDELLVNDIIKMSFREILFCLFDR